MPARRLANLRTQKRIQDVNQLKTADIETMTHIGPYGKGHLTVRPLGCSDGSLLAANATPGLAPEPGSQITIARPQGGRNLFAFPAVALGGGGSTRAAKQKIVEAEAEAIVGYIGIREITATSMEVHKFDASGAFISTVGTTSIGSGFFPRAGHWGVIRGDDTFEDGSLIFARRLDVPSTLKIHVLDIGTNTLHTHSIVTAFGGSHQHGRITPAVRGLDYHNGKIYFVRRLTETNGDRFRDAAELYSANVDLTSVTLQGVLRPDYSEIPVFGGHHYWAWCRVGETIQIPRHEDPTGQVAIDSMGLDGSNPTFDLTRSGTLPVADFAAEGNFQWRASAHGDARGYIMSFVDVSGGENQELELHAVGLTGDTEKVWPDSYIQTRSDVGEWENIIASTGGGVVATATIQKSGTSSAVERFNVTTFDDVPPSPVIQNVDLGGEEIDVFLGV